MIKRINTKDPDTYPPVNVVVRLYFKVFYKTTTFEVYKLGVMRKNFFGEPRFFTFDKDGLLNDKLYNVIAWDFPNEKDSQELQVL